jgi:hypothetical protein
MVGTDWTEVCFVDCGKLIVLYRTLMFIGNCEDESCHSIASLVSNGWVSASPALCSACVCQSSFEARNQACHCDPWRYHYARSGTATAV